MSNLLINERPLIILPTLAEKIGLNEAIILQQVHYWLTGTKINHVHEGRKWVYNTHVEWQKQFPFMSLNTVKRAFKSLEDQKLLITGNFNKKSFDKTKWYSINMEVLKKLSDNFDPYIVEQQEQPKREIPKEQPKKTENKDKPKQPKQSGYTEEFETFWDAYRKHGNKASAFRHFKKAIKKHGIEIIMNGIEPFWEWAMLSYDNNQTFVTRGQNYLKDEIFLETEDHIRQIEELKKSPKQKKSQQTTPTPTYNKFEFL